MHHAAGARITLQVHASRCRCMHHTASACITLQVHASRCRCMHHAGACQAYKLALTGSECIQHTACTYWGYHAV